ncbi:hypothetical protein ACFPFV_12405 [Salinicoccus siamensis]|uniref:hypothetical protein n=1 Tax=Salinicoccus siamensis TaxID=381830 RepID=UPI00361B383C
MVECHPAQALPPTIPMLGNYLIILFKEVPLAATIGVVGIYSVSQEAMAHRLGHTLNTDHRGTSVPAAQLSISIADKQT